MKIIAKSPALRVAAKRQTPARAGWCLKTLSFYNCLLLVNSSVFRILEHKIPHQRRPQTDPSVCGLFGERHAMAVKPFSQMLLIELFSAFAYSQPKCVILGDEPEFLRQKAIGSNYKRHFTKFDNQLNTQIGQSQEKIFIRRTVMQSYSEVNPK